MERLWIYIFLLGDWHLPISFAIAKVGSLQSFPAKGLDLSKYFSEVCWSFADYGITGAHWLWAFREVGAKAKYDCKGSRNQTCETYSTKQRMEKDYEYGILWLRKRINICRYEGLCEKFLKICVPCLTELFYTRR